MRSQYFLTRYRPIEDCAPLQSNNLKMPGNVRTKNIAYDEDDFYDYYDDDYDERYEDYEETGANAAGDEVLQSYSMKPSNRTKNPQTKSKVTKGKQDRHFSSHIPFSYCDEAKRKKKTSSARIQNPTSDCCMSEDSTLPTMGTSIAGPETFLDVPWGGVPEERRGVIREVRLGCRGGLLGGAGPNSGKPSKLQALAAQRHKEKEDRKRKEALNASSEQVSTLRDSHPGSTNSQRDEHVDSKATASRAELQSQTLPTGTSSKTTPYKRQKLREDPEPSTDVECKPSLDFSNALQDPVLEVRAQASTFASALFGFATRGNVGIASEPLFALSATNDHTDTNPFIGPSPDDTVNKAQTKSKQPPTKKLSSDKKVENNGINQGVAALKIDEAPRIKSKNLDVPTEFEKSNDRASTNFVVIGHVDHGKSTLMGRLLYDLKHPALSQRDFHKLQKASAEAGKSSFALAWAMDSTEEERTRGVTIDIATNHFSTETTDFTILDAPGHRDFVPNMIGGTSQADFAVLVVDASLDAFEAGLRGQTKEHALLARSMGISRIIVAVNKMDAAKWNKERYDEIAAQLTGFFTAAGFNQKNISFVPCAGLTGENVVNGLSPEQSKIAPWYQGPTLTKALESAEPARRRIRDPLRLTVSDVLPNMTTGAPTGDAGISGRIDAGNLQVGTAVLALPMREAATVKSIEVSGQPRDWAVAGQIVNLQLVGIEQAHFRSGDVICERGKGELQNILAFTAKCLAFEHLLPGPVDCHRGRMQSAAQVTEFLEIVAKDGGSEASSGQVQKKKKPRVVKPQQVVRLKVTLVDNPSGLPLEPPDRIVLRQEGQTVAAGIIDHVEGYVT